MSEYVRSVTVRVEVDTNKQTYVYEAEDFDPTAIIDFIGSVAQ